mmetsp:Transcript_64542/g.97264  ORF Transcript_64542/g.97264 Transcript_64542/m.97264 type:complete len:99 (+) Transcript_64542:125-421(+)
MRAPFPLETSQQYTYLAIDPTSTTIPLCSLHDEGLSTDRDFMAASYIFYPHDKTDKSSSSVLLVTLAISITIPRCRWDDEDPFTVRDSFSALCSASNI